MDFKRLLQQLNDIEKNVEQARNLAEGRKIHLKDILATQDMPEAQRKKELQRMAQENNLSGLFDPVNGRYLDAADGNYRFLSPNQEEVEQLVYLNLVPKNAKENVGMLGGLRGLDSQQAQGIQGRAMSIETQTQKAMQIMTDALKGLQVSSPAATVQESRINLGLAKSLTESFGYKYTALYESITKEQHQDLKGIVARLKTYKGPDEDVKDVLDQYEKYTQARDALVEKIRALVEVIKKKSTAPVSESRQQLDEGVWDWLKAIAKKLAIPVTAAYEVYQAWQQIKALREATPPLAKDIFRKRIGEILAKQIAEFGLFTVGMIIGELVGTLGGAWTGPGAVITGFIGGLAGGITATKYGKDKIDKFIEYVADAIYPEPKDNNSGTASQASAPVTAGPNGEKLITNSKGETGYMARNGRSYNFVPVPKASAPAAPAASAPAAPAAPAASAPAAPAAPAPAAGKTELHQRLQYNADVQALQHKLGKAKLPRFGEDGKLGKETVGAIKAYKQEKGLGSDAEAVAQLLGINIADALKAINPAPVTESMVFSSMTEAERMSYLSKKLKGIENERLDELEIRPPRWLEQGLERLGINTEAGLAFKALGDKVTLNGEQWLWNDTAGAYMKNGRSMSPTAIKDAGGMPSPQWRQQQKQLKLDQQPQHADHVELPGAYGNQTYIYNGTTKKWYLNGKEVKDPGITAKLDIEAPKQRASRASGNGQPAQPAAAPASSAAPAAAATNTATQALKNTRFAGLLTNTKFLTFAAVLGTSLYLFNKDGNIFSTDGLPDSPAAPAAEEPKKPVSGAVSNQQAVDPAQAEKDQLTKLVQQYNGAFPDDALPDDIMAEVNKMGGAGSQKSPEADAKTAKEPKAASNGIVYQGPGPDATDLMKQFTTVPKSN